MADRTQELIKLVNLYDKTKFAKLLPKACEISQKYHSGQKRASGEPYYTHPIEVAMILAEMKLDAVTIITAVLHDTVEDTDLSLADITKVFGEEVSELVDGVTKLSKIQHESESEHQAENFRKLLVAMSRDIRVLIVKLADRLHNMRTISFISSEAKRHKKALETMEIYAPLAERIGMQQIKNELQDLAFAQLYPDIRNSIINRLNLLRQSGAELVKRIVHTLNEQFEQNNIKAEIISREKTPFSIWHKMKRKDISFEQLSDVMAFRIIVEDTLPCYTSLGLIHSNYHAAPGNFKDYISTPKKNGYQSLHTVIIGPEKQKIEVQIRSKKMHMVAELGMASHWCHKQKFFLDKDREEIDYNLKNACIRQDIDEQEKHTWITELLLILENSSTSPEELMENTKLEMYYDQVFCFTPRGKVIALPKGATTIDFAYAVHSDVGNKCVGAKINGNLVPLRSVLENGDQVEILTRNDHRPLPSWEKFAITGKALSEIRKAIRQGKKKEYEELGRLILAKLLEKKKLDINDPKIFELAQKYSKKTAEDFLYSLGIGDIPFLPFMKDAKSTKVDSGFISNGLSLFKGKNTKKNQSKISIKGLIPGMAVHMASCCHPIPGDRIIGIVQTGKGIAVHISNCETLQNYASSPEKWLDLAWDKNDKSATSIGTINAILLNQKGSLATLALEASKLDANITNFRITNRSKEFFEISLDLEVKGLNHLTNIMASLRNQACIHSVHRHTKA